jgi:hypothetical protein
VASRQPAQSLERVDGAAAGGLRCHLHSLGVTSRVAPHTQILRTERGYDAPAVACVGCPEPACLSSEWFAVSGECDLGGRPCGREVRSPLLARGHFRHNNVV